MSENCTCIMEGLPEKYGETEDSLHYDIVGAFNEMYSMNGQAEEIEMAKCYWIGAYTRDKTWPVIMELKHQSQVWFLLKNRRGLSTGIHLKEDYPTEIDARCRTLRPILREAMQNDEFQGKVKLSYDKLIAKGRSYTVDTLDNLPKELNLDNLANKMDEHSVAFLESYLSWVTFTLAHLFTII